MQIARIENIIYGIILKLLEGFLEEVLPPSKKEIKGLKRFRDIVIK